jgi:SAM-dependent methyltransferase
MQGNVTFCNISSLAGVRQNKGSESMEEREYEILYQAEQKHFWYQALHKNIFDTLHELFPRQSAIKILDAGCGTGLLLQKLQQIGLGFGFDISVQALEFCSRRKLKNISRATVQHLPFETETFDAVISADVLYHRNVPEDRKALLEFYRVLKPGGYLILNLPAFEFLRSRHDIAIHTQRRYKKKQLEILLRSCGFKMNRCYYRNCLLFPFMALVRLLQRGSRKSKPESDVILPPAFINNSLTKIMFADDWLARQIHFPAGLSVFCVGTK